MVVGSEVQVNEGAQAIVHLLVVVGSEVQVHDGAWAGVHLLVVVRSELKEGALTREPVILVKGSEVVKKSKEGLIDVTNFGCASTRSLVVDLAEIAVKKVVL